MFYKIEKPTKGSRQLFELRKKLNAEECKYYVYIHYKDSKPIYVGKGTFNEYCQTDNPQRCFQDAGREYKIREFVDEVEIVGFFDTEKEALLMEETMTDNLKKVSTWIIYNKNSANKHSEKTKKKQGESMKASWENKTEEELEDFRNKRSEYMKNKFADVNERKKVSERVKGEGNPMYGRRGERSPMYGKRGADSEYSRKIVSVNISSGKTEEHPCMREVERKTGIAHGNIYACCTGKRKTRGGCYWYYLDDIFDIYFGE